MLIPFFPFSEQDLFGTSVSPKTKMRSLFTGDVADWPYPAKVRSGRTPFQVVLTMSLKRHNDHFRGLKELSSDVNRIIFHALTVHVTVELHLSTFADYPFIPHIWTKSSVTCSDPNALANVEHAVREAMARENRMMHTEWSPVLSASGEAPHIMMMVRLQRDIGAALAMTA